MDTMFVNSNNSWKFQDDMMRGTLSKWCDRRTDRQTDGQTEISVLRAAWSQLKIEQTRTRTPAFSGYPRRLMITHTIESCWMPSQNKVEWPWRYTSRSKVITCDTPSHASDHLYQIWKESIQNYRRYRADTIFKVNAEWPWKHRSRSKVITCDTSSDANELCRIWKECKQNCSFFSRWKPKN